MGVVYLAKNVEMDRLEVLKVLSERLLNHAGAEQRFKQEIRAVSKLNHHNIVTSYSLLRTQSQVAFAMEYVHGMDLFKFIPKEQFLPVGLACSLARQIAAGLQHAHEKGLVHRDIKPSNVIVCEFNGQPHIKILDFGLAKATSEKSRVSLTAFGTTLGTPEYIAPEQIINVAKADILVDIYSLGCTLYHMLTGKPPFAGTQGEIMMAHSQREAAMVNLIRPDVPIELAVIVAKLMAKSPAKRYQTPLEVNRALTEFTSRARATQIDNTVTAALDRSGSERTSDIVRDLNSPERDTSVDGERSPTLADPGSDIAQGTAPATSIRYRLGTQLSGVSIAAIAVAAFLCSAGLISIVFTIRGSSDTTGSRPRLTDSKDIEESKATDAKDATNAMTESVGKIDVEPMLPDNSSAAGPSSLREISEPHRLFAQWVIQAGGAVSLTTRQWCTQLAELPPAPFTVACADLVDVTEVPEAIDVIADQLKLNWICSKKNAAGPAIAIANKNLPTLQRKSFYGAVKDSQLSQLRGSEVLQSLYFEMSFELTEVGLKVLNSFPNVTNVWFNCSSINDAGIAQLADNRKIDQLVLWSTGITDAGLVHLKDLSLLRDLQLGQSRGITGSGLQHFSGLSKLKKLDLQHTSFADSGMQFIAGIPALEVLGIAHTKVTDAELHQLNTMTTLNSLILWGTKVTDAGVEKLSVLGPITHLELAETALTDTGLLKLSGHKNLKRLLVQKTKVTEDGVIAFRKALPSCVLESD